MQTISSMNPARSSRKIIANSIGLLSTLLLASCGGGGSTDPSATAQSVDDGTKTIQAVSGSTAVPGAWTGRAPKMEVINGITVPPEPAPAINNATLAGVDVNNNGVRDDVERALAKSSSDAVIYSKAFELAKAYNTAIQFTATELRPDRVDRKAAVIKMKNIICAQGALVDVDPGNSSHIEKSIGIILNTDDRQSADRKSVV